ncbi:MAG: heavy metal translocating P-type ATPase [Rhodospirillales bacterium]|nr:MAG: heavy metal translocating P-type ATPase [Rhodospirillales bacterium]
MDHVVARNAAVPVPPAIVPPALAVLEAAPRRCLHCGEPVGRPAALPPEGPPAEHAFCCSGCAAAYDLLLGLGLDGYYRRRVIDPAQRPLKPDEDLVAIDYGAYARDLGDGRRALSLLIEGLHCAACVWLIESVLARTPGVTAARVNMTTRRLAVTWRDGDTDAAGLTAAVSRLGYRLVPYDPALSAHGEAEQEKALLRAMAVAGFAFGNVMLLSVSVWAGHAQGMGPATRDLLHWLSALVALPAIAYAVQPFAASALAVLRHGRTNMDVPITLAVLLTAGMSLQQTMVSADHAYFDSAVALLFFLLVGRYLDRRARGRARSAAENLLGLNARPVTIAESDGGQRLVPPAQVRPGMTAFVAAGDRIGIDGRVLTGISDVDTGLIDGETVPATVKPGSRVFAGTLNLSGPLTIAVTAAAEETLLAEIARMMEAAEQGRGRHVARADRVARLYAPVVHSLAALAFVLWFFVLGATWQTALMIAVAVLIVTCPCALALAVPAVQVIASGRLFRAGVLMKSATALERLAAADTVVFDKTGTLTEGRPTLLADSARDPQALALAAALARDSRHPLARAVVQAADADGLGTTTLEGPVREVPGQGLETGTRSGVVRLGSRRFCGIADPAGPGAEPAAGPELWLTRPGTPPARFAFSDRARPDAARVIADLYAKGYRVALLSGDRAPAVARVAAELGIDDWQAACDPAEKCRRLAAMAAAGQKVLMVGDGLNDAPALAAAHVSASPSTAVDLSQTAADLVFQGRHLAPVAEALGVAGRAERLVRQNIALSYLYNVITVPIAVAGLVTPLVAAVAMSASSLVVILNALRLGRGDRPWTSSST